MQVTGEAHWHVLMRARAIETGCFVIAAAQCGEHVTGRLSYGHSLIVAPWGEVLSDAGLDEGVSLAKIDLAAVGKARGHIPALAHDRDYEFGTGDASVSSAAASDARALSDLELGRPAGSTQACRRAGYILCLSSMDGIYSICGALPGPADRWHRWQEYPNHAGPNYPAFRPPATPCA